jgi:L-alanine-DL-glutamate epimerase-like enolase superfamily enzyme
VRPRRIGGGRWVPRNQIDCGRIGGIGPAKRVADYAAARGVTYVDHTFTSHLALSASLRPFAGLADSRTCEDPAAPKRLAVDLTAYHLRPDANGAIHVPDAPGLGVTVGGRRSWILKPR